jgi:hypothetical protein
MGIVFGIIALIIVIVAIKQAFANTGITYSSKRRAAKLSENPSALDTTLSTMTHRCWYVTADIIPDWQERIKALPSSFLIGKFAKINQCVVRNGNELVMVVVCDERFMNDAIHNVQFEHGYKLVPFDVWVRFNASAQIIEMKVKTPDDTKQRNLMSTFGRKFFAHLTA